MAPLSRNFIKSFMKKWLLSFWVCALIFITIVILTSSRKEVSKVAAGNSKVVVVMELFTSQGCSSCPAADRLLGKYAAGNDDRILPLSFHVDYWNRLGWTDPFSSKRFTERQNNYANRMKLESIYTPQLIINGQKELVGNEERAVASAVSNALKDSAEISVNLSAPEIKGNNISVSYRLNNMLPNASINAVLLQKEATTNIRAGENHGVKLTNYNVVRDISTVPLSGIAGSMALQIPAGYNASAFSIVLFVQDNGSGKISGASKVRL